MWETSKTFPANEISSPLIIWCHWWCHLWYHSLVMLLMMLLAMLLAISLVMSYYVIAEVIWYHCWHGCSLMCEFSIVISNACSHTLDNTVWIQFLVTCDCVTTSNGFSKYRLINLGKMMTNKRNIWNTCHRNKNCENVNYWAVIQQLSFCNKVTE